MQKIISSLLIFLFIISNTLFFTYAEKYNTAEDAVNDANSFLDIKLQIPKYYETTTKKKNKTVININPTLATVGTDAFFDKPVFVFGNNIEASNESTTNGRVQDENKEYRSLGYARDGSIFANPKFTADNEGYKATDKRWVAEPWGTDYNKDLYGEDGKVYNKTISKGIRDYIKSWISTNMFYPDALRQHLYEPNLTDSEKRKYFAANAINPPPVNNFENCMYIIQPPTEHVWGLGIAFYYWTQSNGGEHLNYRTFRLMPYDMIKNDLYAQFEYVNPFLTSKKILPGELVAIGINVNSRDKEVLNDVSYNFKITKDDGILLTAKDDNLSYSGSIDINKNKMNISASGEFSYVYFTMPDSPVNIEFSINEDGKNPEESILSNNKITTRFLPQIVKPFDLDYNLISKKVSFLLEDFDIVAELSLPQGSWSGNATGALNVTNKTTNLLNDFRVEKNPAVNEASTRIARKPEIHTIYKRTDFGDNPLGHNWSNWSPPTQAKIRYGDIEYSGSVSRDYSFTCGAEDCTGHTRTAKSNFFSSTSTCKVGAFIYNGKSTIAAKDYKDQIDLNNDTSLEKNLFWTSEPYEFNVIRLMYHMDETNILSSPVRVDGKYKRKFTNQSSAVTNWKITNRMKDNYSKSSIENGALATDKKFRGIDFPIKSGYYFNPTGKYSFTITTETYKPTTGSTRDHDDLVQAFINSFRYESNLVYKDKNNNPVDLNNRNAVLSSSGYVLPRERPAGVLSVVNSVGLDGRKWLEVEYRKENPAYYTKQYEVIEYPKVIDERTTDHMKVSTDKNADAQTDARWKNILEGYTESGTLASFNSYKYREYVNDKQDVNKEGMYKITEKSIVTIHVNPNLFKAYTHDRMADGNYYVKAWIEDIKLSNHTGFAYKVLPILQGISTLDRIDIKVEGSKSDDIKFGERN